MILKSEPFNFHRFDLTRQAGFVVTIYDEDGLRLAATMVCATPVEAFAEAGIAHEAKNREFCTKPFAQHPNFAQALILRIESPG